MRYIKCISIRQPWASLIIHGLQGRFKGVENRTWPSKHRGDLLIHASKKIDLVAMSDFGLTEESFFMPTGCIIGKVEMVDCSLTPSSTWHEPGKWGFYLKNPIAIDPVPYQGQLSMYDVDMDFLVEGKQSWHWEIEFDEATKKDDNESNI